MSDEKKLEADVPETAAAAAAARAKSEEKPPDKPKAETNGASSTADLDLDQPNVIKVKLGGRLWRAVEPTIAVNKLLAQSMPDAGGDDEESGERAVKALDSIYPQVQMILRDVETGEPPTREFVEENLTGRTFGMLMEKLNEEAQEGNA